MLTNIVPTFKEILIKKLRKFMYKNATNHGLFGPWANELCTHIQKYIVKRI
jgi:hypothetical protein